MTAPTVQLEAPHKASEKVEPKGYLCPHPYCGKVFLNSRALGGHASKQHAGKSTAYNNKIKVRKARAAFRVALKLAKMLFEDSSTYDLKNERTIITKLRNIIIEARPEEVHAIVIVDADLDKLTEPAKGWFQKLALEIVDG